MTTAAPTDRGARARSFGQSLWAMLGISLVLMLSALDQTVVGNALPSIVAELHGFGLYAWVATGYLLASVIAIPVFGRLGDHYGRKPFVLAATAVFTLASLGCASAGGMLGLVLARVAQGIGGGMLVGTAFACIPELFPDTRERLRWQMLLSVGFSVVNAVGPVLGGALTQTFGWRSVFFLNLPLGVLAWLCVWRYLPWRRPAPLQLRFDWLGAAELAIALCALQGMIDALGRRAAGHALGYAVTSAVALALLWRRQRRLAYPLLPPALFADARIRGLLVLSVLAGGVMFALLFYMPLLFQAGYGYTVRQAGLLITPLVLCITVGALVNGRIVARLRHPSRMPLAGFALLLLATAGVALSGRQAPFGVLLGLMLAAGTGLGLILMNLTLFVQASAAQAQLGIATALLQSLRLVGGMLATALTGLLVEGGYRWQLRRLLQPYAVGAVPEHWLDPQVLIADAAPPWASPGLPSAALLEAARGALTQAIDLAAVLLALLTVAALWQLRRLPSMTLTRRSAN